MLTRRFFAGCAICAVAGFAASDADAQNSPAPTSGVKRTILNQVEGPGDGYVTITVLGEVDAGATVARHTHPGVESSFILGGSGTLQIDGQPDVALSPGANFVIPNKVPHALQNGGAALRLASTYVVEKGKPLASPA